MEHSILFIGIAICYVSWIFSRNHGGRTESLVRKFIKNSTMCMQSDAKYLKLIDDCITYLTLIDEGETYENLKSETSCKITKDGVNCKRYTLIIPFHAMDNQGALKMIKDLIKLPAAFHNNIEQFHSAHFDKCSEMIIGADLNQMSYKLYYDTGILSPDRVSIHAIEWNSHFFKHKSYTVSDISELSMLTNIDKSFHTLLEPTCDLIYKCEDSMHPNRIDLHILSGSSKKIMNVKDVLRAIQSKICADHSDYFEKWLTNNQNNYLSWIAAEIVPGKENNKNVLQSVTFYVRPYPIKS